MEFVPGITLDRVPSSDHPDLAARFAQAYHSLMRTIPVVSTGPVNGGTSRGYLFDLERFGVEGLISTSHLNQYLDERALLKHDENRFDFHLSDCTFCHLDLSRRNILMLRDGSLRLVDWEHADFYPGIFEICCALFNRLREISSDGRFCEEVSETLRTLLPGVVQGRDDAERQLKELNRVYQNNLRICL